MNSAADGFLTFLKQHKLHIGPPKNKQKQRIISNLTGAALTERITPEYLAEHITKPVLFMPGIMVCLDQGVRNFVEIGPRMLLSQSIKQIGQAYGLDKNELNLIQGYRADNNHHPLDSLTQLEKLGYCIDWVNLHKSGYFNLES
jgi:acyl transferase domain-containing protein